MNIAAIFVATPYLAVIILFITFYVRRALWRQSRRRGKKKLGFYPSSSDLGNALHQLQTLTRPTIEYVIEEKLDDDAEDDGDAGPKIPGRHLRQQLRRVRRGETVDRLIVQLPADHLTGSGPFNEPRNNRQ
jgi:hypothetical protein